MRKITGLLIIPLGTQFKVKIVASHKQNHDYDDREIEVSHIPDKDAGKREKQA